MSIILSQKFIDQVTIVPLIEVRGTEMEDAGPKRNYSSPECTSFCEIGGHKGYNALTLNTVVPYGTLFRVWLYKNASEKKDCINYDLTITHKSLTNRNELVSA